MYKWTWDQWDEYVVGVEYCDCCFDIRGRHWVYRSTWVNGSTLGQDKEREQMILIEPGDLAAHHCNVIHRADPNLSATHHRRAFAMVYQGASCQRDEAAHQHYLAAAKRQQQAKGMNV